MEISIVLRDYRNPQKEGVEIIGGYPDRNAAIDAAIETWRKIDTSRYGETTIDVDTQELIAGDRFGDHEMITIVDSHVHRGSGGLASIDHSEYFTTRFFETKSFDSPELPF